MRKVSLTSHTSDIIKERKHMHNAETTKYQSDSRKGLEVTSLDTKHYHFWAACICFSPSAILLAISWAVRFWLINLGGLMSICSGSCKRIMHECMCLGMPLFASVIKNHEKSLPRMKLSMTVRHTQLTSPYQECTYIIKGCDWDCWKTIQVTAHK